MVSSFVQLLANRYKEKLDADADQFIAYAVDGAERMRSLINDLLIYSRVGRKAATFSKVDCETVLSHALFNLSQAILESGARIEKDDLPGVWGDQSQLVQLFQNLIGNALKFRRKGEIPHITISALREGKTSVFSVKDNGIGIEPQYLEKVFVIFQRLHTVAEYPGTGIGLALCKKIVELHGGRIWVYSEPGHGSTFSFTLPVEEQELSYISPGRGTISYEPAASRKAD